jgi:hypothetical protein
MTKTRPQRTLGKASRLARSANMDRAEVDDPCELLLAELQSRRARIGKLLQLVRMEAERLPSRRRAERFSPRCENVRTRLTA